MHSTLRLNEEDSNGKVTERIAIIIVLNTKQTKTFNNQIRCKFEPFDQLSAEREKAEGRKCASKRTLSQHLFNLLMGQSTGLSRSRKILLQVYNDMLYTLNSNQNLGTHTQAGRIHPAISHWVQGRKDKGSWSAGDSFPLCERPFTHSHLLLEHQSRRPLRPTW